MTPAENDFDGSIEALLDDDDAVLYERAPCGFLSTTPDGTIVRANATFLSLTGYRREDLVGRKRFAELLSGGGRIYHETHFAPALRMHGVVREIALDIVCADGHRAPVLINSVLERDSDDNPVVVRTAVFDATHRRRYEAELLLERQRAEASELRATTLARTLQQTLIPPHLPTIPGLDLWAEYRPAGDGSVVGGDFYDVFQAGAEWFIVIGDVCGKGAEAAVVTALARHTLRAAVVQDPSPAGALTMLNDALLLSDTERFCTALVLRLRPHGDSWELSSCAAGHPLPLHVSRDGEPTPVGRAGSLVGVLPDLDLADVSTYLGPGEVLVAYTDGVPDARNPAGDFYGETRLAEQLSLGPRSAEDIARAVLADVLSFQDQIARDDIAVVAVGVPSDSA